MDKHTSAPLPPQKKPHHYREAITVMLPYDKRQGDEPQIVPDEQGHLVFQFNTHERQR